MKIELVIVQEGMFPRFPLGNLLVNGEYFPARCVDMHIGEDGEYLLLKVDLYRVEIRSEVSEPPVSLDK